MIIIIYLFYKNVTIKYTLQVLKCIFFFVYIIQDDFISMHILFVGLNYVNIKILIFRILKYT